MTECYMSSDIIDINPFELTQTQCSPKSEQSQFASGVTTKAGQKWTVPIGNTVAASVNGVQKSGPKVNALESKWTRSRAMAEGR